MNQLQRDNRANQLNPNNFRYWRSRGYDKKPGDNGGHGCSCLSTLMKIAILLVLTTAFVLIILKYIPDVIKVSSALWEATFPITNNTTNVLQRLCQWWN